MSDRLGIGECMGLISYKKLHNVATATEPVDIHVHTAENSFLVCEQMENADIG